MKVKRSNINKLLTAIIATAFLSAAIMVGLVAGATMGFNENNIAYSNWFKAVTAQDSYELVNGNTFNKVTIINFNTKMSDDIAAEILCLDIDKAADKATLKTANAYNIANFVCTNNNIYAALWFTTGSGYTYELEFIIYERPLSTKPIAERRRIYASTFIHYAFANPEEAYEGRLGINTAGPNGQFEESIVKKQRSLDFTESKCALGMQINASAIAKYLKFEYIKES